MDQDPTRYWQELCETASKESDPKKLTSLIAEIVKMLDDRRGKSERVASAQNLEEVPLEASTLSGGPKA